MGPYRMGRDVTPLVRNLCGRWGSCSLSIVDVAEWEDTLRNTGRGSDLPVNFEIKIEFKKGTNMSRGTSDNFYKFWSILRRNCFCTLPYFFTKFHKLFLLPAEPTILMSLNNLLSGGIVLSPCHLLFQLLTHSCNKTFRCDFVQYRLFTQTVLLEGSPSSRTEYRQATWDMFVTDVFNPLKPNGHYMYHQ